MKYLGSKTGTGCLALGRFWQEKGDLAEFIGLPMSSQAFATIPTQKTIRINQSQYIERLWDIVSDGDKRLGPYRTEDAEEWVAARGNSITFSPGSRMTSKLDHICIPWAEFNSYFCE
jgi:hypothetical protein